MLEWSVLIKVLIITSCMSRQVTYVFHECKLTNDVCRWGERGLGECQHRLGHVHLALYSWEVARFPSRWGMRPSTPLQQSVPRSAAIPCAFASRKPMYRNTAK